MQRGTGALIKLLAAVLSMLPVHARRAVVAIEDTWQQIREVSLAELVGVVEVVAGPGRMLHQQRTKK